MDLIKVAIDVPVSLEDFSAWVVEVPKQTVRPWLAQRMRNEGFLAQGAAAEGAPRTMRSKDHPETPAVYTTDEPEDFIDIFGQLLVLQAEAEEAAPAVEEEAPEVEEEVVEAPKKAAPKKAAPKAAAKKAAPKAEVVEGEEVEASSTDDGRLSKVESAVKALDKRVTKVEAEQGEFNSLLSSIRAAISAG